MTDRERRRYDAIGAWVIIVTIVLLATLVVVQAGMALAHWIAA